MATKVGIIGAGGMARYHIAGFVEGGAEVVAIADISQSAAEKAAETYKIPTVHPNVEEMMANGA